MPCNAQLMKLRDPLFQSVVLRSNPLFKLPEAMLRIFKPRLREHQLFELRPHCVGQDSEVLLHQVLSSPLFYLVAA